MAETAPDIRELIRRDRAQPDSAAMAHVLVGSIFLALAAVLAALAIISLAFPAFLPLGYGILRPMALLAGVVGFGTLVLVGGSYFVLPRLTGARLWGERLAWAGLVLIAATAAAGLIVVGAGFGDGGEPFALPWWVDLPLLAGLAIPALVSLQTLRHRFEHRTYVSVHFIVTGLVALPLVYLAGNIPGLDPVPGTIADLFSSAAYLIVLVFLGVGLLHYAIVKSGNRPLAGRQLVQVAYWSLLFGAGWFGISQLAGGPIPTWLAAVAAVLGLGFPVGMLAATGSITATLEDGWGDAGDVDPLSAAATAATGFGLVIAVLAAIASFRSAAVLVAYTTFWEGIIFGLVFGVIPLFAGALLFQVLTPMSGRLLFSADQARRFVRLALFGTGSLTALLVVAGVVTGYSWAGGAFTGAYQAVGEGWTTAAGPGLVFVGLAAAAGLVTAWANLSLASLVFRTLTRGRTTTQEVLVPRTEETVDE